MSNSNYTYMMVIHNIDFMFTMHDKLCVGLVLGSTLASKNSYPTTNTKPKTNSIHHNHTCEGFTNTTGKHHIDFRLTMHDRLCIVLVLDSALD